MDSANASEINEFLSTSATRMNRQEEQMVATGRAVQALVAQVSDLTAQFRQLRAESPGPSTAQPPPLASPSSQVTNHHEPRLPSPALYAGEPRLCRAFLTKCSLFFSLQPLTFSSEQSKVAFVLTLLAGQAALWGPVVWENKHPCCSSFQALSEEMKRVFDHAVTGREAARALADLRQGIYRSQIIPSNSVLWRLSADGMSRRSGTCSCMGWLIVSRRRYYCWNYLQTWMVS